MTVVLQSVKHLLRQRCTDGLCQSLKQTPGLLEGQDPGTGLPSNILEGHVQEMGWRIHGDRVRVRRPVSRRTWMRCLGSLCCNPC